MNTMLVRNTINNKILEVIQMREPKYTLTLTYDEITALSRALYMQTKKYEEDAALFQDKYPKLYNFVIRDLKEDQHLQEIVETALCAPSFEED